MRRIYIAAQRGRDPLHPTDRSRPSCGTFRQRLEVNWGGWSNALTSVGKDNMIYTEYY